MQPDKSDAAYLEDMLEFSREAAEIAADRAAQELLRSRALERMISLIGEAANHISRDFQAAHAQIPWSEIIGQRHWLVHGYRDIEWARLLEVLEDRLPELIQQLAAILATVPDP
jgi:uncharacterized protein with HEPN domain